LPVSGLDITVHNEPGYPPLGWNPCNPVELWQFTTQISELPANDVVHRNGKHQSMLKFM